MRPTLVSAFATVAVMAFLAASPLRAADAIVPKPTPAISLPDVGGAQVTLESLKGKVVLVDVWASWCVPCKAAFPAYDALRAEFVDRGFEVLAVNVDEDRKAAMAFLDGRRYQVRVLLDPKGTVPTAFKLKGMPTSYLIDRKGVARFAHEGFNEKLLAQYRREIQQLLQEAP